MMKREAYYILIAAMLQLRYIKGCCICMWPYICIWYSCSVAIIYNGTTHYALVAIINKFISVCISLYTCKMIIYSKSAIKCYHYLLSPQFDVLYA